MFGRDYRCVDYGWIFDAGESDDDDDNWRWCWQWQEGRSNSIVHIEWVRFLCDNCTYYPVSWRIISESDRANNQAIYDTRTCYTNWLNVIKWIECCTVFPLTFVSTQSRIVCENWNLAINLNEMREANCFVPFAFVFVKLFQSSPKEFSVQKITTSIKLKPQRMCAYRRRAPLEIHWP